MSEHPLSILPDTKLDAILSVYPQLETLLLEHLPAFAKLQTPLLRKTVARSLSLEQAASASGANLPDIVRKLRETAGLSEGAPQVSITGAPAWIKPDKIVQSIDARPMLAEGVHPKDMVLEAFKEMKPQDVLLLIAPFVPGPLIELGKTMGCQTWTRQKSPGHVETYFGKL